MTLATIPRYDPSGLPLTDRDGTQAVVIGGSMAGLLAARVLADYFETVTVLERDSLTSDPDPRRGVPHGGHVHVLLEAGRSIMKDLFPVFPEAFLSRGGLQAATRDFQFFQAGGYLTPPAERLDFYSASRPFLEQIVRELLLERPSIEVRTDCQVFEYLVADDSTGEAGTVSGIRYRNGATNEGADGEVDGGADGGVDGGVDGEVDGGTDEETMEADLVVDATGRTSKTPDWLERNGYTPPPVDEVYVDVQYCTIEITRPPDDRRTFVRPTDPPGKRAIGMVPCEDDRWILTCAGVHGAQPPREVEQFLPWIEELPAPVIGDVVADTEVLSTAVASHALPSNRRQRYENLDRFPDGLLVVGDAVASFNPLYGQGMSVAALEALQLHHHLRASDGVARPVQFFEEVSAITDIAWKLAAGSDFKFPETTGPKPFGIDQINWYVDRLARKAHTDPELSLAFFRVMRMEIPPRALFKPAIVRRVLSPF